MTSDARRAGDEPRMVSVNGVRLSVRDVGTGQALVFVHGVLMSGQCFERQLSLADQFRVIIPDLRGHGLSEKSLAGHTVPSYASDLRALLEELDVDRPVLIGWSMGAMVVYEYLMHYGSAGIAGIVVLDQVPSEYAWGDEDWDLDLFTLERIHEISASLQTNQQAVNREFAELMLHEPTDEKIDFLAGEMDLVPPATGSTIVVDQALRDYRRFIPTIDVPTLVAFGRNNKLTPPAGEWIASQIADSRLEFFDAGHVLFYERSEDFNAALTKFAAQL